MAERATEPLNDSRRELPTPEQAVRLLRAKAGELENRVTAVDNPDHLTEAEWLGADLAFVATLLAQHIERTEVRRAE